MANKYTEQQFKMTEEFIIELKDHIRYVEGLKSHGKSEEIIDKIILASVDFEGLIPKFLNGIL